jgi:GntR family transcriptional regulator
MSKNVNNLKSARAKSQTLTSAAEQEIRSAIAGGVYRPGAQLPAESALVEMLGVSRTVVREALRLLEDDGLITRRHGIGTFVRRHTILQNLNFNFGTTEMIRSAGMTPGTASVDVHRSAAAADVAEALNLPVGAPVVVIERIRTADHKPVVYSLDYLPQALIGEADPASLWTPEDVSLYHLLQTGYGQVIEYGVVRILPITAAPDVAEKLRVPAGSVLLYLLQTDYSPSDEPLLYSCEYHLPDSFDFVIMRRGPKKVGGVSFSSEAA